MEPNEYLSAVLEDQTLAPKSSELVALEDHRKAVEGIVRKAFPKCSPTIQYGGSMAKGTMIREAYDLDVICYFPHDDTSAGETLKAIYENVAKALEDDYYVDKKPSALRLRGKDAENYKQDFHIDAVPGRYIDEKGGDAWLYQNGVEGERLKTNLSTHITHVKGSGVVPAIRLLKLWRYRNGLSIKHFGLELLVIDLLSSKTKSGLADQLVHVWTEFRDRSAKLSIEDPANPNGNDLSGLLDAGVKATLSAVAQTTLSILGNSGWEAVFGKLPDPGDKGSRGPEILKRAAAAVATPTKPWTPSV
ncbi:MAG TPA: hypothetical protein VFV19_18795 [Candidatus Polarisedimenticolaceae bacterium]|nr:hypothetical protein [Candidatus Polarisedimenticolaceae bacterium]